ncbi:lipopolysaccharide core biosynthesis mannosyltransferase lpsb [Olea europaea subsp. europaea]|uniref:Lipopolysaccharide core biosynthesis mannosyltransferase lpsb n=1 Tax=Olea europaea subsp. europaea TaxID=158383 RepID=A0A8S0UEM8_OLEEU|nr:lipopolysaccharide core biosynthesis mannosyltransferase lpsb [Olea europaea subsp. europaea]
MELVEHIPFVAVAMIDSHITASTGRPGRMPDTHVLHLGNSKDFMEVAEDNVARRVLREHVRESLGKSSSFGIFNSGVSRGKGQDLFLKSFYESLQLVQEKKLQVPSMHAVVVGNGILAQTEFETELRNFVAEKKLQNRVHFVNKMLNVAPCLASINILVQDSLAWGECFGRITIEAMAFQLPVFYKKTEVIDWFSKLLTKILIFDFFLKSSEAVALGRRSQQTGGGPWTGRVEVEPVPTSWSSDCQLPTGEKR